MRELVAARTGVDLGADREPELMILPLEGGGFTLVSPLRVATPEDVTLVLHRRSDGCGRASSAAMRKRQSASVGSAAVCSANEEDQLQLAGRTIRHRDRLGRRSIETYDMKGNPHPADQHPRTAFTFPAASDFASDSDNDWTDGANVDAHVYAGYTYDYYFKRFGRHGLNNANIRHPQLHSPGHRQDVIHGSARSPRHLLPQRVLRRRRDHGLR